MCAAHTRLRFPNRAESNNVNSVQPLDPAIKTVWRIKAALAWGAVIFAVLLSEIASLFGIGRGLPPGTLTVLAILMGIAWTTIVPVLRHRYWRFALRPEELYLERGIWNRVYTVVPLRRVQHLDVSQDMIERNFDLGRLIVHTAGARSSQVVLPGLRYEDAEHLRNQVKEAITEYAV